MLKGEFRFKKAHTVLVDKCVLFLADDYNSDTKQISLTFAENSASHPFGIP